MGARPLLVCALAAGLLLACRSAPYRSGVQWTGVYEFQGSGSSTYPRGRISLQWSGEGYKGFLTSANRDLELLEAVQESATIHLLFERDGVRMMIALTQRESAIRGTWREMGRGGSLRVTRVSPSGTPPGRRPCPHDPVLLEAPSGRSPGVT